MNTRSTSFARHGRSLMALAIVATIAAQGCMGYSACDTSQKGNPREKYVGGTTRNGVYTSSSPHGELLHFPGGKRYTLEHHLGFEPSIFMCYLAFDYHDVATGKDDSPELAPGAGNSCEFEEVTSTQISIRNSTCSEFWVYVVAMGDGGNTPADAGTPLDDAASDADRADAGSQNFDDAAGDASGTNAGD